MKISIVIPVYNEAAYLDACLQSVANQKTAPYEVIVVDNNSTDNSVEITKKYSFATLAREPKQGIVFARNRGFDAVRGDIIGRIDADTVLPRDWVEKVTQLFVEQPTLAALTGAPKFYDAPTPSFFNNSQVLFYQRLQKLLTGTFVLWGANMAIRRKSWQQVASSCSERTDIDEDIDLTFCLRKAKIFVDFKPALQVGASLQRGNWGLVHTARYLSTWPRDYALHKMYIRAAFILLTVASVVLLTSPILLFCSIRSSIRRD